MSNRFIAVCSVLLATAGIALPQPPRPPRSHDGVSFAQRRADGLAMRLGLSDSQKQQVLALFTAADQDASPVEEKLTTSRRSLRDATRRNAANVEIDQLAATIGTLTGQLEAVQAKADTAVFNLLTPEQRQKMERSRGMRRGPGFAPNGFGPGGPHGPKE